MSMQYTAVFWQNDYLERNVGELDQLAQSIGLTYHRLYKSVFDKYHVLVLGESSIIGIIKESITKVSAENFVGDFRFDEGGRCRIGSVRHAESRLGYVMIPEPSVEPLAIALAAQRKNLISFMGALSHAFGAEAMVCGLDVDLDTLKSCREGDLKESDLQYIYMGCNIAKHSIDMLTEACAIGYPTSVGIIYSLWFPGLSDQW